MAKDDYTSFTRQDFKKGVYVFDVGNKEPRKLDVLKYEHECLKNLWELLLANYHSDEELHSIMGDVIFNIHKTNQVCSKCSALKISKSLQYFSNVCESLAKASTHTKNEFKDDFKKLQIFILAKCDILMSEFVKVNELDSGGKKVTVH